MAEGDRLWVVAEAASEVSSTGIRTRIPGRFSVLWEPTGQTHPTLAV